MLCSKCGAQIPDGEHSCPKCHAPAEPTKSKKRKIALLILVVAIVFFVSQVIMANQRTDQNVLRQTTKTVTNADSKNSTDNVTTLQVYAETSLSKAMSEVESLYTQEHPEIAFNHTQFTSMSRLNTTLEDGTPADVVVEALPTKTDMSTTQSHLDASTLTTLLSNDLVIVTAENNTSITSCTMDDIASGKYKLAVGDSTLAVGDAAREALTVQGCYTPADSSTGTSGKYNNELAGDGMVQQLASMANLFKSVQAGNVNVALVNRSDVYLYGGVKIVGTVPSSTYTHSTYPAAVTTTAASSQEAQAFLTWCNTDANALRIWQKWGFTTSQG